MTYVLMGTLNPTHSLTPKVLSWTSLQLTVLLATAPAASGSLHFSSVQNGLSQHLWMFLI